eukprot:5486577-Prymnesium_polylepis.1
MAQKDHQGSPGFTPSVLRIMLYSQKHFSGGHGGARARRTRPGAVYSHSYDRLHNPLGFSS